MGVPRHRNSSVGTQAPSKLIERLRWLLTTRKKTTRIKQETADDLKDSAVFELAESASLTFSWAHFYELSLLSHLYLMTVAFGLDQGIWHLKDVDEVFAHLHKLNEESDGPDHFLYLEESTIYEIELYLALAQSCDLSIKSIATYSLSMNELIARVRGGSDDAFFKAIKIDPSSLFAPSMARRFSFALLENDRRFMSRYRSAIKKGPDQRRAPYSELRIVQQAMKEMGAFQSLSRAEIHDLIVNQLGIYGKKDSDTLKALFALLDTWKHKSTN